ATPALARYVGARAAVLGASGACRSSVQSVEPDGDGVVLRWRWDCAGLPDPLAYRSTLLTEIDPAARQIVLIIGPEGRAQALLDKEETEVALTSAAPPSLLSVALRYVAAGIEH